MSYRYPTSYELSALSYKGSTADFDSVNGGSIPSEATKKLDEADMLKVINCLSKEYLAVLPLKPIRDGRKKCK